MAANRYTDATPRAGVNWTAAGGTDDGTCSASACHDNDTGPPVGTSLAWNTAYSPADNCLMCHANGADGVTDAAGADSVDDQWTSRGHGSVAGGNLDAQTTSDAAGCDFCHIDDVWVDHLPTKNVNNPYRLRINQTTNEVCSACHVTGDSGFDPPGGGLTVVNSTVEVDETHSGSKHAGDGVGIADWPQPAGGCCYLTDEAFARKFFDILDAREGAGEEGRITREGIVLLSTGRHFRLSPRAKLVVGRNEVENALLENYTAGRARLEARGVMGAVALVEGEPTWEERALAARVVARYGKGRDRPQVEVEWREDGEVEVLAVAPEQDEALVESLRF